MREGNPSGGLPSLVVTGSGRGYGGGGRSIDAPTLERYAEGEGEQMGARMVLHRDQRGITFMEVMIVLSILIILNAIMLPAISGRILEARDTGRANDEALITRAVSSFTGEAPLNRENGLRYPAWGDSLPTPSSFQAVVYNFKLPNGRTTTLYVKPLDFFASYVVADTNQTVRFLTGYLKNAPKHASDRFDPAKFSNGRVVFAGGATATGGVAATISVWVLDQNAVAHALIDDNAY
ncbi:MAG: hypothetical protein AAB369_05225 [Chloroflexota bacterium]